jgi:hypothetical protein
MVDMGMGDQKTIDFTGLINTDIPIAFFDCGITLMQPTIDGQSMRAGFQNETGPCYCFGRAHKLYLHTHSPFIPVLGESILAYFKSKDGKAPFIYSLIYRLNGVI